MSWIGEEIAARGGEVRFDAFMEMALYHPVHGYYSSDRPRYGRSGDFLTAPTASHWYATVLACLCRRLAANLGPITFVDLAAGDGSLVSGLCSEPDDVIVHAIAIERSESMRELQQSRFCDTIHQVSVHDSLDAAQRPTGLVFLHASELYDALPVRRVAACEHGVEEFWVAHGAHGLEWVRRPADADVTAYFDLHGVTLAPDQIAEVNLAAEDLHRQAFEWAGAGVVSVTLDYGYEARRLYNPRGRLNGSLACYREHQLSRDPLQAPGEQDITAHVNWDDLRRAASPAIHEVGLWQLAEFIIRSGLPEEMERADLGMEAELVADVVHQRQEIKRLLDPEGMGSDLKVLVQAGHEVRPAVAEALSLPGEM